MSDQLDDLFDIQPYVEEIQKEFLAIDWRNPLALFMLKQLQGGAKFSFHQAESPSGEKWPDIAEATKQAKGRDDILIDTERLVRSLTESGHEDAIRVIRKESRDSWLAVFGTGVEYSAIHNEGLGITKREHVGTTDHQIDELVDQLGLWGISELERVVGSNTP